MSTRIFVGNLPFSATEESVHSLFAEHGDVESVVIVTDRETGRSRGFGFVEMEPGGATKAIAALDQHDMDGRALTVNEARPREKRPSRNR